MENSEIYEQALAWGLKKYPESPEIHHLAFASVLQFACTGKNRRDVIKTMRTLVAMDIFYLNHSETLSFDNAVQLFKDSCYGEILIEHAKKWKHDRPGDDDEKDIKKADELMSNLYSTFIHDSERDQ